MKKIVCELCEGTEFTKEGGMFVCQGCGTKYAVEEAKSMMREVEGDVPVTVIPIGNPNQQQVDNMLLLATTAFEADNNQEAENYCNQVITLDAMNYKAWLLKGKAAGWQSTIQNQRITEAAHAFAQAIDFAPEDEKEAVKEETVEQLKRLGLACISLRKNRFSQYPDAEELAGFDMDRKNLLSVLMVLLSKGIAMGIPEGYEEEIADLMNIAAVAGFNTIRDRWNNDNHPNRNDLVRAIDEGENCISLIKMAIDASDDDDDRDITRYENLVVITEWLIGLKAYESYSDRYPSIALTDKAKNYRRTEVSNWKAKIESLKREIADKKVDEEKKAEEEKQVRIKAYWEAHTEEKAALEAEKKGLETKCDTISVEISDLDTQINAQVPTEEEIEKIIAQIKELKDKQSKLGLFAGKENKQIAREIASLQGRIYSLKTKAESERSTRNAPLTAKREELQAYLEKAKKRITAIDAEFSKDPEA